jgi:hypothetical protein
MSWDLKEPECLSQARLMVAAPEFVYEQLKFYSDNVGTWEGKKELETLLLKRNEKLINLALAQFATHKEIVQQLYNQVCVPTDRDDESYNLGLRVACLSNRHFDFFNWPDFDLNGLMARGFTTEVAALLANPSIPGSVLEALFKKTDYFAQVDEKNWLWMIQASARNERLNIDQSDREGPDLTLLGLHRRIFEFLETAPVSSHSAHVAFWLLNALNPYHTTSPNEIADVLERWGKVELKDYKGEDEEGVFTHLSLREELRCLIASLYNRRSTSAKSGPRVFGSADDDDIARRCAFYAGADLSEKQIEAGFGRDNDVFVFAVLKNWHVLLNKTKRALIEGHLSGNFFPHEYRRRCEDIGKRYKWFDVRPVSESGRDLFDEFQQQSSKEMLLLEKISAQYDHLSARLKGYERKVYWVVIIVIVAMYLIVNRYM